MNRSPITGIWARVAFCVVIAACAAIAWAQPAMASNGPAHDSPVTVSA